MRFNVIKTVFSKELREMLRDRRSMLVMFGIPLVLYPLMTIAIASVGANRQQTLRQQDAKVAVVNPQEALDLVTLLKDKDSGIDVTPVGSTAEADQLGTFDAVVLVADNAQRDLLAEHPATAPAATEATTASAPATEPKSLFTVRMNRNQSQGPYVEGKLDNVFKKYEQWILEKRLETHHLPKEILSPVTYQITDTATGEQRLGKMLSMIIPLLLLMTGMLGALFPALNATTTERELGTLETLLVTPAARSELLIAKGTLVFLCGLLTAFLNMASMSAVLWRVASSSMAAGHGRVFTLDFAALGLSYLAAVPAILLFTTLVMIVGLIARNFREANSFASPVMLVPMASIVAIIAELPSTSALMLTPILSTSLIIRDLLTGQATIPHFLLAFCSSLVYAGIMLSVATRLFTNEQLVNPSWEPLSIRGFARGGRRTRRLPAVDEAIVILSMSLLLSIYLGGFDLSVRTLVLTEVLYIAGPALLVAGVARYDWRTTFSLRPPGPRGILAGVLLGAGLIPVAIALQTLQNHFWPADTGQSAITDKLMLDALRASPILFPLLAGLLAGTCEELLYRGPIQAALLKRYTPAMAIVVTGIVFSLAHFDLHGAPVRALLGCILGFVVYRTGSIFPAMIAHILFDALQLGYASWQIQHETAPTVATQPAIGTTIGPQELAILAAGIILVIGGGVLLRKRPKPEQDRSEFSL